MRTTVTRRNLRAASDAKRERRHKELIQIVKENYELVQKGRLACGKALIEIRDDGYWEFTHTSFKDYCSDTFDISESYAHRLMDGIKVITDLPTKLQSRISNEAQARALGKVPEEDRSGAIKEASKNGHITAMGIEKAAAKIEENKKVQNLPIGKSSVSVKPESETPQKPKQLSKEELKLKYDDVGTPMSHDALPFRARWEEVKDIFDTLSKFRVAIKKARDEGDFLWVKHGQEAYEYLSRAYSYITDASPDCMCLICQGSPSMQPGGCNTCGSTGMISQYRFDHFLPKELREIRLLSNAEYAKKHPESPLNNKK